MNQFNATRLICFRRIFAGTLGLAALLLNLPAAEPVVQGAPATETLQRQTGLPTFAQWAAACKLLPANRAAAGRVPSKEILPIKNFSELDGLITNYFEQIKTQPIAQRTNWVGPFPSENGFFDINAAYFLKNPSGGKPAPFQPFSQRLEVEAGSEVYLRADLHGDIHSFIANIKWLNQQGYLDGFQITRPHFYMVFLGDYTDRGIYGLEVLYTLYRLKLANPSKVITLRGNHEEVTLQARYGLLQEGALKYGQQFSPFNLIRAYEFFPVVLYLGVNGSFVQCNHGGMEPGYAPATLLDQPSAPVRFQLLGALQQKQFLQSHPEFLLKIDSASRELVQRAFQDFTPTDPNSPIVLGFVWNDFTVVSSEADFAVDPDRAYIYGRRAAEYLLQNKGSATNKLLALFRGHQHSSIATPMMQRLVASKGVFRHWQERDTKTTASVAELEKYLEREEKRSLPPYSVWTFNVSPDSGYGAGLKYDFDSFALLTVQTNFSAWNLRVVNIPIRIP